MLKEKKSPFVILPPAKIIFKNVSLKMYFTLMLKVTFAGYRITGWLFLSFSNSENMSLADLYLRNDEGSSSSWRNVTPHGNLDQHKEGKRSGNGKYVDKCKPFLSF